MSEEGISRRHLLGTGAAVGAGAMVGPGAAGAVKPGRRRRARRPRRVDVAIVGAGFAGLTAALDLTQAGKKSS